MPGKLWSLAEIDALLADEGLSESEKVQTEKAHEPKEQTEHAEKNMSQPKKKRQDTGFTHIKKEPNKKSDDSFSIDPAIFDEILSGGSRREKPRAEKSMPRTLKKIRKLSAKTMTRKKRPE